LTTELKRTVMSKDAPAGRCPFPQAVQVGPLVFVSGQRPLLPSKRRITIQSGEEVTLRLPGGGGFGDPHDRARSAIESDVQEGYLTVAESKRIYG